MRKREREREPRGAAADLASALFAVCVSCLLPVVDPCSHSFLLPSHRHLPSVTAILIIICLNLSPPVLEIYQIIHWGEPWKKNLSFLMSSTLYHFTLLRYVLPFQPSVFCLLASSIESNCFVLVDISFHNFPFAWQRVVFELNVHVFLSSFSIIVISNHSRRGYCNFIVNITF